MDYSSHAVGGEGVFEFPEGVALEVEAWGRRVLVEAGTE